MSVPQIMEPDVLQPSEPLNTPPWPLEIVTRLLFHFATELDSSLTWKDEGACARQRLEDREGRPVEVDRFAAGLAVGEEKRRALKIHPLPAQVEDLAQPRAGEKKEAQCPGRLRGNRRLPLVRFGDVSRPGLILIDVPGDADRFCLAD